SRSVSISRSAMSELETWAAAAARRRAVTAQADQHLLLLGEVTAGDLGQGPVADPELDRDSFGLAGCVEYPDTATGDTGPGCALPSARTCAAGTSALTRRSTGPLAASRRPLARLRFDAGWPETERRIGHPQDVLLRVGHDSDVRGHRRQQDLVVVGGADHHVVRHD